MLGKITLARMKGSVGKQSSHTILIPLIRDSDKKSFEKAGARPLFEFDRGSLLLYNR